MVEATLEKVVLPIQDLGRSLRGFDVGREFAQEHFPEPTKCALRITRSGEQLVSVCFLQGLLQDWLQHWDNQHEAIANLTYGEWPGDKQLALSVIRRHFNFSA